jgi:hypothetical protein
MTTADDITHAAALDPRLGDGAYLALRYALRGLDPITGEPAKITVPVRTKDLPVVDIDLADYRTNHGDWNDDEHALSGGDGPDVDGHVVYIGQHGYRHDQLPHVIAWLTAAYHASSGVAEDCEEL